MSKIVRSISALLILAALISASCTLAEAEEAVSGVSCVDCDELDTIIDSILSELRVDKNTVSVALKYTGTGEYYYYNADRWMYSASLYKMPVCMTYSHKIKTGELEANSLSGNDAYVYDKILGHSDFSWVTRLSHLLYGNGNNTKALREQDLIYSGYDENVLPEAYFGNSIYSARFYLGIIEELYNNSSEYPNVLENMTGATPTKYFCRNLGSKYPVAQKYGSDAGSVHAAGIIYTENPILLVIMTTNKNDAAGNRIIGTISESLVKCVEDWSSADD